ncbi:putative lipoprotein [Streptomyces fumigatiscleroticus]|nr:putative lipoprotein [Streptomyces fumigatiscleroticus]
MKSTTVRRVALSIAAATALTGTAACSADDSSDRFAGDDGASRGGGARVSPIAALRSAERSTDRADSARVESSTTMGAMMSMTADGVLGWGDGLTGTLTITYTGGTMADTMRRLGTTSMQARYLPDAYYARMGDTFAEQAGGKHWVRYAYDDLEDVAGSSGAHLGDQMRNTTPNQSVKLLLASGDVHKVGEETVRGERATHYSGTVDVADLVGRSSGLSAAQLADLKKQLTQAGVTTETLDIWVNDRDLLVKKIEKGHMATGQLTQTAYYSDYGVKVTAERPPAGDTQDFKDLLERQGGTLGDTTS